MGVRFANFISFFLNIPWKCNNLVSLRPTYFVFIQYLKTEGHSANGNLSGYMCESDFRSRGCEFGHAPVHEIISTAILLPSPDSFKKGCCQLQAKVFARSTG